MTASNNGTLLITLASDPTVFTNNDGSRSIRVSGYVSLPWVDKESGRAAQTTVSVEDFIAADRPTNGAYEHMFEGDTIGVQTFLKQDVYIKKGETEKTYEQKTVVFGSPELLTPRSVSIARRDAKLAAKAAKDAALAADEAAVGVVIAEG